MMKGRVKRIDKEEKKQKEKEEKRGLWVREKKRREKKGNEESKKEGTGRQNEIKRVIYHLYSFHWV